MTRFENQRSMSGKMKWPPEYQLRNCVLDLVHLSTSYMNVSKPLSLPGLHFHFWVKNKMRARVSLQSKVYLDVLNESFKASGGEEHSYIPTNRLIWAVLCGIGQLFNSTLPITVPNFSHQKSQNMSMYDILNWTQRICFVYNPWCFLTKTSVLGAASHHQK